ncbi:MAG: hypothetical protein ABIN99_06990 [Nitrosospira sp.]
MVIYATIRRMFYREHLTISDIQRRTSLSRNTIKKWLQEPSGSEPRYQRVKTIGKLTPFEPKLLLALEADSHRPKRDRGSAFLVPVYHRSKTPLTPASLCPGILGIDLCQQP